jgi:hypothetical protein
MRKVIAVFASFLIMMATMPASFADVIGSEEIMSAEQSQYSRQQILSYVDGDAVQQQLVALGVDSEMAKSRIAGMTDAEISTLNAQMNDMPAGGIVSTVVTVLVVILVLDLLGVTDVYSFINPI